MMVGCDSHEDCYLPLPERLEELDTGVLSGPCFCRLEIDLTVPVHHGVVEKCVKV